MWVGYNPILKAGSLISSTAQLTHQLTQVFESGFRTALVVKFERMYTPMFDAQMPLIITLQYQLPMFLIVSPL